MRQPDREAAPFFSQPIRQAAMMLAAVGAFGAGAYVAYPRVAPVFLSNPALNGFILVVFCIGLVAAFYQMVELARSVSWIMAFTRGRAADRTPSRLLAPLATLMRGRDARAQISSTAARSILESVDTRMEEARDITRYLANLLIFLGLLGTFYGLATTVPAVVETVRSLAPKAGEDTVAVFGRLMTGLEGQLGGMGTAFASSLLGLAGSLIIGLLELFANHGQNRFYRELEEWLSSITRLSVAGSDGETSADTAIINALAEHMAEQMDALQTLFTNSDVSRSMVDDRLGVLAEAVERLADRLAGGTDPMPSLVRVADGQERLMALLAAQSEEARERAAVEAQRAAARDAAEAAARDARREADRDAGGPHIDAEGRMRLRSIDVQLLRILEELGAGRQETLADLRGDLAELTRAVQQLGRAPSPAPTPVPAPHVATPLRRG